MLLVQLSMLLMLLTLLVLVRACRHHRSSGGGEAVGSAMGAEARYLLLLEGQ